MSDHLIHRHRLPGGGAPHEAGFVGTPSGGPGLTRFRGAGFLLHRRVPSTAGSYLGSTGPSATDGEPSEWLAVPVAHRGVLLATRRPTVGNPPRRRDRPAPASTTSASIGSPPAAAGYPARPPVTRSTTPASSSRARWGSGPSRPLKTTVAGPAASSRSRPRSRSAGEPAANSVSRTRSVTGAAGSMP